MQLRWCFVVWLLFLCRSGRKCNAVSVRFEAEDSQVSPSLGHAPLLVQQLTSASLCNDSRCRCSNESLGTVLQCSCTPQDQSTVLVLHSDVIPANLGHLSIQNCPDVWIQAGSLAKKRGLADVSISNCGRVIFEPESASSVESPLKPTFSITTCRSLILRTGSFARNSKQPISLSAGPCGEVEIEGSTFSQIQRIRLTGIPRLFLHPYAFKLDPPASTEALVSDIALQDVKLANGIIESNTFPSPLRNLKLDKVIADSVASSAFAGVQVVKIQLQNCTIGTLSSNAFKAGMISDSIEIFDSKIGIIESGAISSAANYFGLHSNAIGRLEESALNMPVAEIILRSNQIGSWKSNALRLREWNRMLVDNNTIKSIDSQAFYSIGEAKTLAQLVVSNNVIRQAQSGAFSFSAVKPELSGNVFYQSCDCSINSWAADLTKMSFRVEANSSGIAKFERPNVIWLDSELFNSSLCALSPIDAQCLEKTDVAFLPMVNYTHLMCTVSGVIQECVIRLRGLGVVSDRAVIPDWTISENPVTDNTESVSTAPTLSFLHLDRDLLIVIAFSVMIGVVVISLILWIICAKRRTSKITRRASENQANETQYDDRTLAPLLAQEKHLGGAILSSDSIHRLAVKDYKPELTNKAVAVQSEQEFYDQGNPIYAELVEATPSRTDFRIGSPVQPPVVPLLPPGGFSSLNSSLGRKEDNDNKRTIDRGTQTILDPIEPRSSVTDDFAEAVLAAIKEKLDLAPLYSQVKDHLPNPADSAGDSARESYDLIRVIDAKDSTPRLPLNSESSDGTYSKPWTPRESVTSMSSPTSPTLESAVQSSVLNTKTPFSMARSLPKWPPPASKGPVGTRSIPTSPNKTISSIRSRPISPPAVINPIKDSKPPWRVPAARSSNFTRPTNLKKRPEDITPKIGSMTSNRYTPTRPVSDTVFEESQSTPEPPPSALEIKLESPQEAEEVEPVSESPESAPPICEYADPQDVKDNEYSLVTPKPFSFIFKKPLFQLGLKTSLEPSRFRPPPTAGAPPKPARQIPAISDYSEPKDKTEHVYAELPETVTQDRR